MFAKDKPKEIDEFMSRPKHWGAKFLSTVKILLHPNAVHRAKSTADKYNKMPAQVGLRYLIELDVVPNPVLVHKHRLIENIEAFDFRLTDEEKPFMDSFNIAHSYARRTDHMISNFKPFSLRLIVRTKSNYLFSNCCYFQQLIWKILIY